MGIHRLLHSSSCFLNTNTAITRQLIGAARTLEAEWWQVCGEKWVRGQRKMSRVLGAFGLLDFTMLWPVLGWRAFWNLRTVYFFNFPNFFSGRGESQITKTADNESADTGVRLYFRLYIGCSSFCLADKRLPNARGSVSVASYADCWSGLKADDGS